MCSYVQLCASEMQLIWSQCICTYASSSTACVLQTARPASAPAEVFLHSLVSEIKIISPDEVKDNRDRKGKC